MTSTMSILLYTISSLCFILALKGLSAQNTARTGNMYGIVGMAIAILTTLMVIPSAKFLPILVVLAAGGVVGFLVTKRIPMTALPQLIAAFHSLVGLSAVAVALAAFYAPASFKIGIAQGDIKFASLIEMTLGCIIGAITFSGSLVAFAKLQGLKWKDGIEKKYHPLALVCAIALLVVCVLFLSTQGSVYFFAITLLSFALGYLLIMPVGGADMPVIVSMLNSYSGWAAAGIGLTLDNPLLIITGALVGASGAILSYIMCKGMNRSLIQVMLGGFGNKKAKTPTVAPAPEKGEKNAESEKSKTTSKSKDQNSPKEITPHDAAEILSKAKDVIVVPGYGLAVAHAQHALREIQDFLSENGTKVRYAIHPVAGRMPGHMNVLLAEAQVDYDDILELEEINDDFAKADVALVIGANDITNPAAKNDTASPIYGMPVLNVDAASKVIFVKRSLGSGYAGIDNPLFIQKNTVMVLGDAKKVCENILKDLGSLS